MHVAVVTFQAYPDQVAEVIKRYHEFGVPWMKSQKGMANFRVMTDKKTGKGRHVAVWETEADALALMEPDTYALLQQQHLPMVVRARSPERLVVSRR